MKTSLLNHRSSRPQGSVLSHLLCAFGGILVGAVVTFVGVGLVAAFALPNVSAAHEKSRASSARSTAFQATTNRGADAEPEVELVGLGSGVTQARSEVNSAAREAMAKRNAQSFASVFAAGQAAGVEWRADDVDSAVSQVVAGATPKSGPFAGRKFHVPNRAEGNDLQLAKDYLRWDNADASLSYSPTDADPTN